MNLKVILRIVKPKPHDWSMFVYSSLAVGNAILSIKFQDAFLSSTPRFSRFHVCLCSLAETGVPLKPTLKGFIPRRYVMPSNPTKVKFRSPPFLARFHPQPTSEYCYIHILLGRYQIARTSNMLPHQRFTNPED